MELFDTIPTEVRDRQEREMRVYRFLDEIGIEYLRADHESAETMEKCREIDGCIGAKICKNLFLCNRQETVFYLCMMPGDKPFKTKELSAQINSARLSFAREEYMLQYLDILPGSVSVFGLMNDRDNHVKLLVDRDLLKDEYIGCHPCVNTSVLRLKTQDIFDLFLPRVGHEPFFVDLTGE